MIALLAWIKLLMQEPTWVVGRVCCDSEGRLNDKSVLLEGSIERSQVFIQTALPKSCHLRRLLYVNSCMDNQREA